MSNGLVIYCGPSELDGRGIVAIATGISRPSANVKTGAMVQTFILRQDQDPISAVKSGADSTICGACVHRGAAGDGSDRTCYVNIGQAPLAVWRAWERDAYPTAKTAAWARGRLVRFGAYGDPAAVPLPVWQSIRDVAAGTTGYTHQWRDVSAGYAAVCMASVETAAEYAEARRLGYRTFRAGLPGQLPRFDGEAMCPSLKGITCAQCMACHGNQGRQRGNIVIPAHGSAPIMKRIAAVARDQWPVPNS